MPQADPVVASTMDSAASAGREPAPVLFVHYGDEWIRGSERVLLDLLDHLDRDRFPPVVWCNADTLAAEVQSRGIPVRRSRFSILFDYTPPRFALGRYRRLVHEGRQLVREYGIRLLHASSGAPNQWLLPVARGARLPLVVHLHAVYEQRDRYTMGLHQASLAMCVSQAVAAGLLVDGMPSERIRVSYNGVSTSRLEAGDAVGLRRDLGIAADAVVAMQAGALVSGKGWDVLLAAMERLAIDEIPLHLLVVGDGPDRQALQQRVNRYDPIARVHFLGQRDDVGALYRDVADIAVLASRQEAFGLSMAEAATMGLPGVASRVGGIPEVVEDGITGLLVSPEDPEALAAALRTLATDAELRRRMGDAARERALSLFSVEQNAASFHSAYEELLACPAAQFGWRGAWTSPAVYTRAAAAVLGRRLGRLRSGWASNSP